jgi:hypothetical protein
MDEWQGRKQEWDKIIFSWDVWSEIQPVMEIK